MLAHNSGHEPAHHTSRRSGHPGISPQWRCRNLHVTRQRCSRYQATSPGITTVRVMQLQHAAPALVAARTAGLAGFAKLKSQLFTLEFELIFPAQLDWLSDFAQLLGVLIVFPALYYAAEIFWRVSRVDEPIHIHQTQQKRTAFPPQRSLLLHTHHLLCRRPESSSSLSSSVNFVARRRLGPRFS